MWLVPSPDPKSLRLTKNNFQCVYGTCAWEVSFTYIGHAIQLKYEIGTKIMSGAIGDQRLKNDSRPLSTWIAEFTGLYILWSSCWLPEQLGRQNIDRHNDRLDMGEHWDGSKPPPKFWTALKENDDSIDRNTKGRGGTCLEIVNLGLIIFENDCGHWEKRIQKAIMEL